MPDDLAVALKNSGAQVPVAVDAIGLIDTGCSHTCVDYRALEYLGIPFIDFASVSTPGGEEQMRVYPVKLEFPELGNFSHGFDRVSGVDVASQGIYVLIGRDLLANFSMQYDGPSKKFTIDY